MVILLDSGIRNWMLIPICSLSRVNAVYHTLAPNGFKTRAYENDL